MAISDQLLTIILHAEIIPKFSCQSLHVGHKKSLQRNLGKRKIDHSDVKLTDICEEMKAIKD